MGRPYSESIVTISSSFLTLTASDVEENGRAEGVAHDMDFALKVGVSLSEQPNNAIALAQDYHGDFFPVRTLVEQYIECEV